MSQASRKDRIHRSDAGSQQMESGYRAPAPRDIMTTLFADDFASLNLGVWKTTGYDWAPGSPNPGNSSESQCYDPAAITVQDGQLVITAAKLATPKTVLGRGCAYQSGMVTTSGHLAGSPQQVASGRMSVTVRAKIPQGEGLWPAIWMLPQGGGWPPEIDILETWGDKNATHNAHWAQPPYQLNAPTVTFDPADFHDFGIVWTKTALTFTVDGVQAGPTVTGLAVPSVPMYLLINLAVQGAAATDPAVFPARMIIDKVTVTD